MGTEIVHKPLQKQKKGAGWGCHEVVNMSVVLV